MQLRQEHTATHGQRPLLEALSHACRMPFFGRQMVLGMCGTAQGIFGPALELTERPALVAG